jgi:hypothetical protein
MDDLHKTLIDRELVKGGHTPLPTSASKPRIDRWQTANKMISGYQNGWSPNPVLTNLMETS